MYLIKCVRPKDAKLSRDAKSANQFPIGDNKVTIEHKNQYQVSDGNVGVSCFSVPELL